MGDMKKVAWNASEGIIMEVSNRRVSANTWFINGNLRRAFHTLTAIKQSVIQSFSVEERAKLKGIEEKFRRISTGLTSAFSSSFNDSSRRVYAAAYNLGLKFYSEYNDLLMDLLEDRGYLIGEQSDASKMKF